MEAYSTEKDISFTIEPRIAAVGIGGAGCNVVSGFYSSLAPIDAIAINTDKSALENTAADKKIYICKAVTKGEGTRGDIGLGKKCAKVHEDEIEKALSGYDMVFLIAGLGGGTGAGALPVVADICNRNNITAFVIGINPFSFETGRMTVAGEGLRNTRAACPNTFVIENDKIINILPDVTINNAMRAVNNSIVDFVCGITNDIKTKITEKTETHMNKTVKRKVEINNMPENPFRSGIEI